MTATTEQFSEVRQLAADLVKAINKQTEQFTVLSNKINRRLLELDRRLMAFGEPWGVPSEISFRNAMDSALTDLGFTVQKI